MPALYLLSMLEHEYNIIIDIGVGTPEHSREVHGGLNATDKCLFLFLIKTLQLSSAASSNTKI